MLMLPDKKLKYSGEMISVWDIPNQGHRFSGLAAAFRWQNIYRGLPVIGFGTHFPDEARKYADIGFGISLNLIGLHFFVGFLFESYGRVDKDA